MSKTITVTLNDEFDELLEIGASVGLTPDALINSALWMASEYSELMLAAMLADMTKIDPNLVRNN